jgi:hypothetical protein
MRRLLKNKGFPDNESEELAELSGGSVEMAIILSDKDLRLEVLGQCASITRYLRGEGVLSVDLSTLEKKLGKERLLDIMIYIYRRNLLWLLEGKHENSDKGEWSSLFVDNQRKVHSLIKVLLDIQKGLARNLNIKNSLKGMLNSVYSMSE